MAKKSEVIQAFRLIHDCKPHIVFEEANKIEAGYFAVLKYLAENNEGVSSKEISNYIGISSARMTVLIKKLEAKNWIEKSGDEKDARIINISLSDEGKEYALKTKKQIYECMEEVIDKIGMENFENTIGNIMEIKGIIQNKKLKSKEEKND